MCLLARSAPESDCAAFAVRVIDRAEHEILVGAYGLTTGAGIVEALLRAHRRGVEVKLIADKTTPCGRNSGIDPLASAGVPVWIDHSARIAHVKTMVIDGAVTLNGSYNWTRGAAANSEDRLARRRHRLCNALAIAKGLRCGSTGARIGAATALGDSLAEEPPAGALAGIDQRSHYPIRPRPSAGGTGDADRG